MKVRDLRTILEIAASREARDNADLEEINGFFTKLAQFDDMSLASFWALFRKQNKSRASSSELPQSTAATIEALEVQGAKDAIRKLASAMRDDSEFDAVLDRVAGDKSITKPMLLSIFRGLFGVEAVLPSKATRAQMVRAIRTERIVRIRNERMESMLAGRVPVEG